MLFRLLTYVQLALFLFFSALACASAIAKEKDRRTFVLLLMTDLRNYEIVLGKMLGSLLPIAVLQLATVPFLMLLLCLGGIGLEQILLVILILAATTLAAGTLGGLIALWRDKTFQSLALTMLCLGLYEVMVWGLLAIPRLVPSVQPELIHGIQQCLEPFLALRSAHQPRLAGETGLQPAVGYSIVMFGMAVLLSLYAIFKLRVWNPSGEPIMQRERPEEAADKERELIDSGKKEARASVHAAPGAVRHVEGNPILWREINTRAYGRRPFLIKLVYLLLLGCICYYALEPIFFAGDSGPRLPFAAAYGLLPVGVLSLLLVTAQATTAITSERDTGALDLLLVTDLTPKEFIFGKLLGICYNTKEYLLPPLLLTGVYGVLGYLATPPRGHPEMLRSMNATALVCVVLASVIVLAFAVVLGIHVALRTNNSQVAIVHALSTIFFLTVGTLVCIALILINRQFEYQWGSFLFFLVAGVGGLWYVLSGDRPSGALSWASVLCPLAVLYTVMSVLVGRPGSVESADPFIPFLVIAGAFCFALAAMLIPLLSEFDVAMGRTSGGAD